MWRVRTLLVVDYARELGVRGALFSLFAEVACFRCLDLNRAALEAMGFRVRRLPVGFCLRFFVFL